MGVLYLLLSHDGKQVKIGITKSLSTLQTRLVSLGGTALFDLNASKFFQCERARAVEQFLHFHFRDSSIVSSDAFVKDGTTECFSAEVLTLACDFIVANSAGCLLEIPEAVCVGATRLCVRVDANEHVSQQRLVAQQVKEAERRASIEQFNAQCYSLLAQTINSWNDRRVVVGRYRADGELRIALRAFDVYGEVDPIIKTDWTPV